jgi:hypothetical protein
MADYSELMKLEKKPKPSLSTSKNDTVPVELPRYPENLKTGKPESRKSALPENVIAGKPENTLSRIPEIQKPRIPESLKTEKYSTQLPPSLIKRIKQHALEQDIKDYEVVQFALEAYLSKK